MKPVTTEVDQCVTAAGYLDNRAIPAAGAASHECVKTGDYLDRRTVPALPNPVENVDTLTFDYSYDPAGNVTNATRTLGSLDDPADTTIPTDGTTAETGTAPTVTAPDPTPEFPSVLETPNVDSRDYAYDSLNRLVSSETSTGNTAEYAYDPAGNRVQATATTAEGTTDVTATFNSANQLTGSQTGGTSSTYGYDGNGNRTSQNENGITTSFTYQTDNRLTGVSREGRSSNYAYDGLGRQLSTTENSGYGAQTTKSVWDGTSIVQQSNPASGTSTLMRDAFGEVALQTGNGEPSWALLDRLGTTAAQAVGGSIAQLSTFDDWGNQSFDTIGWNSAVNYTGETTDAGYGLNNYYSRTYDPTSGSWMSQDSWRGLLSQPQTVSRYAYVTNNPVSSQDLLGYMSPDSMEKHANANNCTFVSMTECGRVTTAPPSIRVIEDYASDGGPHLPETWEDTDYVFGPSGEIVEIPARHVQGFDEEFPGYETADSTCLNGLYGGSWNGYCAPGAGGGKSLAEMCANQWVAPLCVTLPDLIGPVGAKIIKGRPLDVSTGGTNYKLTQLETEALVAATRQNSASHIFADKHNLDDLVFSLGSERAVVEEFIVLLRGANLPSGTYKTQVVINGIAYTVTGINTTGLFRVSDAWRT